MEQELWRKVEVLFHAALERTPDARQTFLAAICGEDTDLRQQVELLSEGTASQSFLEIPAIEMRFATAEGSCRPAIWTHHIGPVRYGGRAGLSGAR
jgi:hypothetical protein